MIIRLLCAFDAFSLSFALVLIFSPTNAMAQLSGQGTQVLNLPPAQETSIARALAGSVPLIFTSPYIEQGKITETMGDVVKDYIWVVPGNASIYKKGVKLGFKGVITRITVSTITGSAGMKTNYILYKNFKPTNLSCVMIETQACSFNYDVPIDVDDEIGIGVYLPKTDACRTTGVNGCAGATPIITLMVRMK